MYPARTKNSQDAWDSDDVRQCCTAGSCEGESRPKTRPRFLQMHAHTRSISRFYPGLSQPRFAAIGSGLAQSSAAIDAPEVPILLLGDAEVGKSTFLS